MRDKLILSGMQFQAHGGVAEYEKQVGHRLEVDVELSLDLTGPGSSDLLEGAVDFSQVYSLVQRTVHERQFNLLENVAYRTALGLLEAFPVVSVLVRMRKPAPPVGGIAAFEAVEIYRERVERQPA